LFRAIAIPARSFLHLVTQVEQIVCLRNIHAHLAEGGRLLLNFFTPRLDALLKFTDPTPNYVQLNVFKHPVTGEDLEVSYRQVNDLNEQVQDIRWRFCSGGRVQETPMKIRWIYRNEFLLLAKLAGFDQTAVYGDFDKSAYKGEGEMVWVVEK